MKGGGVDKKPTPAPGVDKKSTPAPRVGKKLIPESRTRFKAWISKYALSLGVYGLGVYEDGVEDCFDISPTTVVSIQGRNYYHRNQWHRTREEALEKAEKMRVAKIASLQKQIAQLKKLTFDKVAVNEES